MGRYVVRRLLWTILVVLIVTLLTFVIFYVMPPGNPAVRFAGKQPTPELIAEVEHNLGLDKSLPEQYGLFLKRLFTGDGDSCPAGISGCGVRGTYASNRGEYPPRWWQVLQAPVRNSSAVNP